MKEATYFQIENGKEKMKWMQQQSPTHIRAYAWAVKLQQEQLSEALRSKVEDLQSLRSGKNI